MGDPIHRNGYEETCPQAPTSEPVSPSADISYTGSDSGVMPHRALREVQAVLEFGATKYAARGFVEDDRTVQHHLTKALGHAVDYMRGTQRDPETGRHPLAHAAARMLCALERNMEGLS